jgi:signal peptidase II
MSSPNGKSKVDSTPTSRRERILAYRLLLILAAGIFIADQITKIWIIARLPLGSYGPGHSITIIPDFLYLVHVGNTGAAWSMLTGKSTLLAIIAIATLVGIYIWRRALALRDPMGQFAFGLLCGGITGNLVDRLQHGHVVDFLDFHFWSYIYPTFNVADSAIVVGVVFYIWHSFRSQPEEKETKTTEDSRTE